MRYMHRLVILGVWCGGATLTRAAGGDWTTIYGAARDEARQISSSSLAIPLSPSQWDATESQRRERWREMLGLSPLPARTPLKATITGSLEREDYVVEKIHFQSLPGAYVIGNIYRPAEPKGRLPAVLYLCGHTKGPAGRRSVTPPATQTESECALSGEPALVRSAWLRGARAGPNPVGRVPGVSPWDLPR